MPVWYYPMMIGVIILSYFIGSVNFAVIISRAVNRDVRQSGSGNAGTMNMLRTFGLKFGILTLLLDVAKGAVPALLGWFLLGKEIFCVRTGQNRRVYSGARGRNRTYFPRALQNARRKRRCLRHRRFARR